jgi:toxin ParE1/3/4
MSDAYQVGPIAARDLQEQYEFLADRDISVARRFLDCAHDTFRDLAESPDLGNPWPYRSEEFRDLRVWRLNVFRKHLAFYRTTNDGVLIIRVLDGARDIDAIFAEDH